MIIHYKIKDSWPFPNITICWFSYIDKKSKLTNKYKEVTCKLCLKTKKYIILKENKLYIENLFKKFI